MLNEKIKTGLTWLMRMILIALLPYLIYKKDLLAFLDLIAIVAAFTPAILRRSYKISIPWWIEFLVVFAFVSDIIGSAFRIYHTTTGYDFLTHLLGTFAISVVAFMIVFTMQFLGVIRVGLTAVGIFTLIFAIAIGALYEIGEFLLDVFLGTNSQISLANTMIDLIFDTIGGIATAIFGVLYFRRKEGYRIRKELRPFIDLLALLSEDIKKRVKARREKIRARMREMKGRLKG